MEKKKVYIFFAFGVKSIGGTEMYAAGKAAYLQKRGWQVFVFCSQSRDGRAIIPSMNQYILSGCGMNFFAIPPYKLKRHEQEFCLNEMLSRLQLVPNEEYDIIIESFGAVFACWGELFAAKIGARHFFSCCEEDYRYCRHYVDNLDFFYFKWKRNEVICTEHSLKKLFNGYKNVNAPLVDMPENVHEMDPIQDVAFPIERLARLDWNICHIGRAAKEYVPSLIEGVGELARRHPDKKINFIMVGNATSRQGLLEQNFRGLPNIFVTLLGDMVPIPRILFSKIDVVCAISQSARFAANEGVLTIVGNTNDSTRTPGVLGYDTKEQLYGEGTFSYVEALENVLVKKLYVGKKYSLPKLRPADEYYENFWTIVKNAATIKEYYTERLSQERIRNWTAIFPFGTIARGSRIILFGETEITKDYRQQIESQKNSPAEFGREFIKLLIPRPYCQVVATVDEHPENFDDTVVGVDRLKNKDYDAIVVCCYPQQAQAVHDKIRQIVPDMVNRVIYNLQALST